MAFMRATPFSIKASCVDRTLQPEKFVRPGLSRTGIPCYGLAGWKCELVKILTNNFKIKSTVDRSHPEPVEGLLWRFHRLNVTITRILIDLRYSLL